MASKRKTKAVKSEGEASAKEQNRAKLKMIRERDKQAREADHDNRLKALDDMKFVHVPGCQGRDDSKTERGNRPFYEHNKTRVTIKRVVNDMRANRPSGKVRGVEEGDKDTAETLEGLIRNICNVSDFDTITDNAGEHQVAAGMGCWRVATRYVDDNAFDQDIFIDSIRNPLCLYPDPACQDPMHRDSRYWILSTRISKTSFDEKYPNAEAVDYESADDDFDDDDDWENEDSVRLVEYWYKEPVVKSIYQLEDGKVVDELPPGLPFVKSRTVQSHKIKMCIASGKEILEEAEWAGSQFPFVLVYGESLVIDGKHHWYGLTRNAKDPARAYNYAITSIIETVALSPQSKYWATAKQAEGHLDKWATAHNENIPVQLYNPDPMAPGAPVQMPAPQVPAALMNIAQVASEDIKAVTGIFDASLGKQGNETSGVAISARQEQGEIAVFNYMDNLSKGIRRTWEILIDLIPKIYDTERAVRILGVDGAEKYARVNSVDPMTGQPINDLSRGKYDVTVTVGPSFATRRQEAAEIYFQMARSDPMLAQIAGDLMYKSLDVPYANEIGERYQMMLPPSIQQSLKEGKQMPPEVAQAMAQVDQAMQMVQQQAQLIQEEGQKLQGEKAQVEQGKSAITKMIADLQVKRAEFDANVEKSVADLTKREAQLILKQAQAGADEKGQEVENDRQALSSQVQEASVALQQQAADFRAEALAILAQIQAVAQPQPVFMNPPKRKQVRSKKVNGEWISEVQEFAE